jgi:hypothetical protein
MTPMADPNNDDELCEALRDLGPPGVRAAEWFQAGFAQAQAAGGPRSGHFVALCGREALGAILDLGGRRTQSATSTAIDNLLATADAVSTGSKEAPEMLADIDQLRAALHGPGPHARRLETVITDITQRRLARTQADLFDRYLTCLDNLNALTHSLEPADFDEAVNQLRSAFEITGRLLGPLSPRLDEIDPLIAVVNPTTDDVEQLRGWHGDPRILNYFFSRINGPGWFRALAGEDILVPPPGGGWWPALEYLRKLGASDAEEIASWLDGQPAGGELTTQQVFQYFQLAREVAAPIDRALASIASGDLGDPNLLALINRYLDERPAEGQDPSSTLSLIKQALQALIDGPRISGRAYLTAELLETFVRLAAVDPLRWLGVLRAKTTDLINAEVSAAWAMRRVPNLLAAQPDALDEQIDQFVVACRDVDRVAAAAGVAQSERIAQLRPLPTMIAGRLIAVDLLESPPLDQTAAVELLQGELATSDPMPETLELLRRITQTGAPELIDRWRAALGTTPTPEEIAAFDPTEQKIPENWARPYSWSVGLPQAAIEPWNETIELVRARYGEPMTEGLVVGKAFAFYREKQSPFTTDELNSLAPAEAATKIAEWSPEPGDDFGPDRYGLSSELTKLVTENFEQWTGTDAGQLVRSVDRPIYLMAYVQAVSEHDEPATLPASMLDVIEALIDIQTAQLASGQVDGPRWPDIWYSALPLLVRLPLDDPALLKRVWDVLDRVCDPNEQIVRPGPTTYGSAIAAAIGVADKTMSDDQLPDRSVAMLDDALELPAQLGESVRTTIGINLGWLLAGAPTWIKEHLDQLIGDTGLGRFTFKTFLERGRPSIALLELLQDRIWAALSSQATAAAAEGHILHGLVWKLDGYDPAMVAERLAQSAHEGAISTAAEWLYRTAVNAPDLEREPTLDFWEAAVDLELPSAEYEGFGYLAVVNGIDDDRWLDLILRTAQTCETGLALPNRVAEQAAEHPDDPRALRIVTALLASRLDVWYIDDIGHVGMKLLHVSKADDEDARKKLREQLIEREFFDVRE